MAWKRYNDLEFIQCACRFTENCTMCDNGGGGSKRQEVKTLLRRLKRDNPDIEKSHLQQHPFGLSRHVRRLQNRRHGPLVPGKLRPPRPDPRRAGITVPVHTPARNPPSCPIQNKSTAPRPFKGTRCRAFVFSATILYAYGLTFAAAAATFFFLRCFRPPRISARTSSKAAAPMPAGMRQSSVCTAQNTVSLVLISNTT